MTILKNQTFCKMTTKRKRILSILEASAVPLSAYDVMDIYQQQESCRLLAWSAYRMLGVLEKAGLIVHLKSANKYMAAKEHEADKSGDRLTLFIICNSCSQTHPVYLDKQQSRAISQQLDRAGFESSATSLEMPGVCKHCQHHQDTKKETS